MTSSATPPTGQPVPSSPAPGLNDEPTTTVRIRPDVAAERNRVVDALRAQGWQGPDAQGNFFWLGVGDETAALAEHFRAAGILVRPFVGEGVRVSIGTTSDNERVLAAAAAWSAEH